MRNKQGFTIVELMIVVAVIGIISTVGFPLYANYTARAKVTEAMLLLAGLKSTMVEYYDSWGRWPTVDDVGGKTRGSYVTLITSGQLSDDFYYVEAILLGDARLNDKKLRMTYQPSIREWQCTSQGYENVVPQIFLPASCRL